MSLFVFAYSFKSMDNLNISHRLTCSYNAAISSQTKFSKASPKKKRKKNKIKKFKKEKKPKVKKLPYH